MHARIQNDIIVEYPLLNLYQLFPNVSLPADLTKDESLPEGIVYVHPTSTPAFDPLTQGVRITTPIKEGSKWVTVWEVYELDEDTVAANLRVQNQELVDLYDQHLTRHLDQVARTKRYDSRITCALRAGYPGPFQAEGQAFALWMEECNQLAYQWWAEIEAGTRPMFSTPEEFIAQLPPFSWPQ